MYDIKSMAPQNGMTENTLSTTLTEKPTKTGRPPRKGTAPVPWSVRGIEPDTRRVIEKAAERAGKTIGQYINEDVRSFAQGQLTQTQIPAAPIDIQNQIDYLTKMVEGIANRIPEQGKKSFWKRVFS
jgi:hypothetical protein